MKVMNGLVITLKEDKRFLCVWLFYWVSNFAYSRMDPEVPRYQSSPTSWDHFFLSQCIQQQWSIRQNYFHSEYTADCSLLVSGRKERKLWSQPALIACFMLKATSIPQAPKTPQANHSQYSSFVEELNLIVDSKSQLVELDNSPTELHVPLRRKKSLQSYCFGFPCLMRFDMTFDVTLRDSSFSKLTNSCN